MTAWFLSATCVDAKRAPLRPASSAPQENVLNPCDLRDSFLALHETIVGLADEAEDAGDTALTLRHRSSSRAYKQIEEAWFDMKRRAEPALDTLAYMPISLDSAPAGDGRKAAALSLAAAYRTALARFVDYTHYAVLYERSESSVAMNAHPLLQSFNFGVTRSSVRGDGDTYTRGLLDGNVLEVKEAVRGMLYPEYRYGKLCKASFAPARRQAASRKPRSSVN
jgi:hypothetical protein